MRDPFVLIINFIGYVIGKLSIYAKISTQTSPEFLFKEDPLKIKKDLELVFRLHFCRTFR